MLSIWQVTLALATFASIVLADPQTFGGPLWPVVVQPGLRSPGPTPVSGPFRNPAIPPGRALPSRFGGRTGGNLRGTSRGRFGRQVDFTAIANNIFTSIQNATRTMPTAIATSFLGSIQNATRSIPGLSAITALIPGFGWCKPQKLDTFQ